MKNMDDHLSNGLLGEVVIYSASSVTVYFPRVKCRVTLAPSLFERYDILYIKVKETVLSVKNGYTCNSFYAFIHQIHAIKLHYDDMSCTTFADI